MEIKILTILTFLTKEKKKVACLTPGRQKRKEKITAAMVTFNYDVTGPGCLIKKVTITK